MPQYTGPNDPELPQIVKDNPDEYSRAVFVEFNNSTYRLMAKAKKEEPELSADAQMLGAEAMNSYDATGQISVGGFYLGAT